MDFSFRSNNRSGNVLEDMDFEKALKSIPQRKLTILTFKRLYEHEKKCYETSLTILKILKQIGIIIGLLALEKLNEMFHIVEHLPGFGGIIN